MKKVLAMLLTIVMVFSLIPVNVFAEGNTTPVITFETTFRPTMNRGDTFTVTAKIANNPGIASFTHSLSWNEDVITFTGFEKKDNGKPKTVVFAEDYSVTANNGVFAASSDFDGKVNGTLYTAYFKINESGSGNLNLGLSTMTTGKEFAVADKYGNNLTIEHDFSAIKTLNFGGPAIPENGGFKTIRTNLEESPYINGIEERGYVTVNGENIPFYIAYIPEGVSKVYLTTPPTLYVNITGDSMWDGVSVMMGDLWAEEFTADGFGTLKGYEPIKKTVTNDGVEEEQIVGYNLTVPLEHKDYDSNFNEITYSFVEDEDKDAWHGLILQDNIGTEYPTPLPTAMLAFRYGMPPYKITVTKVDGCTVYVMNEKNKEITSANTGDYVYLDCDLDEGYNLVDWQVTCGGTPVSVGDGPVFFEMPEGDVVIKPIVKAPAMEYTIGKAAMTNGSVVAKANGAEVTKAEADTTITLEATADEGYKLDTLTVTMDSTDVPVTDNQFTMPEGNVIISATFALQEIPEYDITKAAMTGGSVTIKAGEAEVSTAAANTEITLEAAANDGYTFTSFTVTKDGVNGDDANVAVTENKFTMPDCAVTVSAEFTPIDYTVTNYTGTYGSVTASKTQQAHVGEEIILTVTPAEGYQLKEGTLEVTTTDAEDKSVPVTVTDGKFNMPAGNVIITAEFEKASYTITLDVTGEGTVKLFKGYDELASGATAQCEDVIEIIAEPTNVDYTLTSLIVQSGNTVVPVDQDNDSFTMPAGNVVVKAVFGKINKITNIEIQHPILKTDAQNNPVMNLITGYGETLNLNTVLGFADLAATQTVTWSSSNESIATVDRKGNITPHMAGTAVITATASDRSVLSLLGSENASASFTLKVTDPAAGYRVSLPQDDIDRVVNGQPFTVDVTFGHSDASVTGFNAYELKLSYDANKLTLNTTSNRNGTTGASLDIKDESGDVTITCIGEDKTFDAGKLTLQFTPKVAADTHIALVSAKVATSQEALNQNAAAAQVLDQVIQVKVTNYYVTLTEDFIGEQIAQPNKPYTFTAKDPNYNYDFTGSTMGTGDAPIQDNENGTFTIPNVTGDIVIQSSKSVKTFTAELAEGLSAAEAGAVPTYKTDFEVKVNSYDATKIYRFTVTIGGVSYTASFDKAAGILTIDGEDITGDVIVTYTEEDPEPEKVYITFEGEYANHATGASVVDVGSNYTFTINAQGGYTYTVTYKLQGEENETTLTPTEGTHSYTITNLQKNVTIYIKGTSDLVVDVLGDAEGEDGYLTVNEQVVFKVVATQTLAEGECLTYDGNAMYYNAAKKEWYYLVTVSGSLNDEAVAEIMAKVQKASDINYATVGDDCDVNGTQTVDINDAQLVYDIYNNKYALDFNTLSMQKLLMADVNSNNSIEVTDAAYVVAGILGITLSDDSTVTPDAPESSES